MAIDTSGEWWIGSDEADIPEYLIALNSEDADYLPTLFHPVQCADCGANQFLIARAGQVTQRMCAGCNDIRFICHTLEDWESELEQAAAETFACVVCKGIAVNVSIGLVPVAQSVAADAVKWFYAGTRCAKCGVLGCFNDGKVGRGPTEAVLRDL